MLEQSNPFSTRMAFCLLFLKFARTDLVTHLVGIAAKESLVIQLLWTFVNWSFFTVGSLPNALKAL